MLEVGNSDNGAGPVTDVENQSHFSLWAIIASPLIAGNDLRNMSETTKAILTNKEIIAINQDAMGLQGALMKLTGEQSIWAKPLNGNGERAVVLFNEATTAADITVRFDEIGLRGRRRDGARPAGEGGQGIVHRQLHGQRRRRTEPRR